MRYNEQLPIKLYDKTFTLQAIIDDYAEISFSHNLYEAGDFSISINYNIPNAQLFQRGMFIQFGNDEYMFGEILSITDTIAQDGKGSQTRTITGKDARFLFKRRVIKNMNSEGSWVMTAKGELCMRNLIADQCGVNAEEKRRLPIINNIPSEADALGASYSISESFSNLYDTLVTIATQSEIGWRVRFTGDLTLEVYRGTDLSNNVQFSTDFDSLANGTFTDTSESFANTVYVGGKGTGEDRDVYEGEIEGAVGLDRYEAFDNQSGMTTESEYETEALSVLSQYGQTITVNGNGLAKCPYVFKEQYNIGDIITIAFSGKSAKAQILGVTEHWGFGTYGITFSFGKPVNDLNRQLQLILKQIQKASNKTTTTSSVKYYTIPTDTEMPAADVIYDTIGFTGTVGTNATFKLYLDNERTGAKTYHIRFKQLGGTGKLTLTTGVTGASNLVMNAGTYVAIIYVDNLGNVTMAGATATSIVETGNNQPVTSDGVNTIVNELETEISGKQPLLTAGANIKIDNNVIEGTSDLPTDAVLHYSFDEVPDYPDGTADVRILKSWTSPDSLQWTVYNFDKSIEDNELKLTALGSDIYGQFYSSYLSASNIQNKIIKIRFKTSSNFDKLYIQDREGSWALRQIPVNKIGENYYEAIYNVSYTVNYQQQFAFFFFTNTTSNFIIIEDLYIGDGSYSTPVIDNANGKWNAINTGSIVCKGVSGKAIKSLNNQYAPIKNDDFKMSPPYSFACWVKIKDFSVSQNIIDGRDGHAGSDEGLVFLGNKSVEVGASGGPFVSTSENIVPINEWTHYAVVTTIEGNNIRYKIFINGVLEKNQAVNNTNTGFKRLYVNGRNADYSVDKIEREVDDFIFFDRALSEKEVVALYNNKANTPKYYNLNNYKLPAPPITDGSYTLHATVSGGVASYSWL